MKIHNFILVLILIAFVAAYICEKNKKSSKEVFSQFYGYHCPSCHDRSRVMCTTFCENCGFCINEDGIGSCIPGDVHGPYFQSCMKWEHNDKFSKFIWKNPKDR